jgi:hypothetical protein
MWNTILAVDAPFFGFLLAMFIFIWILVGSVTDVGITNTPVLSLTFCVGGITFGEIGCKTTLSLQSLSDIIHGATANPSGVLGPHRVSMDGRRVIAVRSLSS